MTLKSKWVNDPDKYERLSQPFETQEEAEKAMKAFLKGVSKLREKHKISDVLVGIKGSFKNSEMSDKDIEYMCLGQHGHSLNGLPLASYLYDKMKDQHNSIIEQLKA